MKKIDKHIEVVMTYIADLNIMGLKNCEAICGILEQYYTKVDFTIIGKESDLDELVQKKPDLVLSGVKYIGFEAEAIAKDSSNKIWLSDHLGTAGINYTGSSKSAIALEFDKAEAKKKMQDAGVATAPFFTVEPDQYPDEQAFPLSLPLFVKPLYQGGGSGIGPDSVVTSFEEFQTKVQAIHDVYRQPALAEGYLRGREFTVAILDIGADDDLVAMPVELIAQANSRGDRILGFHAKDDDEEEVIAITDPAVHARVISLARRAFRALGARDFGRIDIRMNEKGEPFFLEANLMPGFGLGYFYRACSINRAMSHEDMILQVVEIGLAREEQGWAEVKSPDLVSLGHPLWQRGS